MLPPLSHASPQSALPVIDNPLSVRVRQIIELLNQERNTFMKVSRAIAFSMDRLFCIPISAKSVLLYMIDVLLSVHTYFLRYNIILLFAELCTPVPI